MKVVVLICPSTASNLNVNRKRPKAKDLPETWSSTKSETRPIFVPSIPELQKNVNCEKRLLSSKCLYVRLSAPPFVYPHGTIRLPLDGFK
jgi:hypothetical protein